MAKRIGFKRGKDADGDYDSKPVKKPASGGRRMAGVKKTRGSY